MSQELADNARKYAGELLDLLEQEFEALKAQDLNSLELLQEKKPPYYTTLVLNQ